MWEDIKEKGDYDLFTQSEKTPPYERERPVAKLDLMLEMLHIKK